jgi:serine/threonine protein kinase
MRTWWDDAEGTVLDDRYEVGERLGRGGAGVVHRAWDRARDRAVAVKLLPATGAALDARTGRQEAEVLGALDHPQLVALHDVLTTDDGVALVMELVDGPSLADRLDRGALPLADAALVLRDVASGLAHAHSRGIVHRDVKPGNVLVRQLDGRVTGAALADFGIARFAEATRTTSAATILGTVRYLSPEQVRGERATAASDVYSLGLAMVAAVAGRPAFPGSDAESLGGRLVRSPALPEELPHDWVRLLTAMTALEQEARPTARAVAAAAASLGTEAIPLAPLAAVGFLDEDTVAMDAPAFAAVLPARRPRRPTRFAALAVAVSTAAASLGLVLILTGTPAGFDRAGSASVDLAAGPAAAAPTASARPATPSPSASTSHRSASAAVVHAASTVRSSTDDHRPTSRTSSGKGSGTAKAATTTRRAAPKQAAPHVAAPKAAANHHAKRHVQKAGPKKASPKQSAPKPAPKHGAPKGGHGGGKGKH